jgi:hypothetical protein
MILGHLATLLTLGLQTVPASQESSLVLHDLHDVLPRWDGSEAWTQSLLFPPATHPEQDPVWAESESEDLDSFDVLDLLSQVLGDELRREGREIAAEDGQLSVLAPEPIQRRVQAVLESLRASLGATVQLQVDVLTLAPSAGGELPQTLQVPSVLPAAEVQARINGLVGAGAQRQSFETELTIGKTAWLDARRRIPFVIDYDVEIACTSLVYDAVTAETYEGTRIGLRAWPARDGLGLATVVMRSELLGPIQSVPLGMKGRVAMTDGTRPNAEDLAIVEGPGKIDSPRVLERALALNLTIPDGQAVALSFDVDLEGVRRREVVFLSRTAGELAPYVARQVPQTNRTLIALDTELFKPVRLALSTTPEEGSWRTRTRGGLETPWVQSMASFDPPSYLSEWIKLRFSVWREFGPWILIVTDPAWDRDAATELERLVASRRDAPALVEATLDLVEGGESPRHPVRARFPMLSGSEAGIAIGRGSTVVADYDVEVAQGSGVADPLIDCVFEGLATRLRVETVSAEARGIAQVLGAPRVFDPEYEMVGPLAFPQPQVLRIDGRRALGASGRVRFGARTEGGSWPSLSLELAVGPASATAGR